MLSRPFSKSNLRLHWEQFVSEKAQLAVKSIKAKAEVGVCDVFEWWTYYTTDVIGRISFGESFGLLELGKVSLCPAWSLKLIQQTNKRHTENRVHSTL